MFNKTEGERGRGEATFYILTLNWAHSGLIDWLTVYTLTLKPSGIFKNKHHSGNFFLQSLNHNFPIFHSASIHACFSSALWLRLMQKHSSK